MEVRVVWRERVCVCVCVCVREMSVWVLHLQSLNPLNPSLLDCGLSGYTVVWRWFYTAAADCSLWKSSKKHTQTHTNTHKHTPTCCSFHASSTKQAFFLELLCRNGKSCCLPAMTSRHFHTPSLGGAWHTHQPGIRRQRPVTSFLPGEETGQQSAPCLPIIPISTSHTHTHTHARMRTHASRDNRCFCVGAEAAASPLQPFLCQTATCWIMMWTEEQSLGWLYFYTKTL